MGQTLTFRTYGELLQNRYDRERDKIVAEQQSRVKAEVNRISSLLAENLGRLVREGAENWPVDELEWRDRAVSIVLDLLEEDSDKIRNLMARRAR